MPPGFTNLTGPNGFENGFVFDHVRDGADPSGSVDDAVVIFDFGYNYNSELDAPAAGEYDLATVLLHEFTHTLGYLSVVEANGDSGISGGDPGVFTIYETFLQRGDGTALFGGAGDFLGTSTDLTSNDIFFNGTNVVAANGGNLVPIYAPASFADGSSISHNTVPGSVMNFSVSQGVENRAFHAVDIGILQDIGWNIAAVPEPSSLICMCGFCLFGLGRRRRRRLAVNAT